MAIPLGVERRPTQKLHSCTIQPASPQCVRVTSVTLSPVQRGATIGSRFRSSPVRNQALPLSGGDGRLCGLVKLVFVEPLEAPHARRGEQGANG